MKLTNNSSKIIHVGATTILPDETAIVDDTARNSPAVALLIESGDLKVGGKSATKSTGKAPKGSGKAAGQSGKENTTPPQTGSQEGTQAPDNGAGADGSTEGGQQ